MTGAAHPEVERAMALLAKLDRLYGPAAVDGWLSRRDLAAHPAERRRGRWLVCRQPVWRLVELNAAMELWAGEAG